MNELLLQPWEFDPSHLPTWERKGLQPQTWIHGRKSRHLFRDHLHPAGTPRFQSHVHDVGRNAVAYSFALP